MSHHIRHDVNNAEPSVETAGPATSATPRRWIVAADLADLAVMDLVDAGAVAVVEDEAGGGTVGLTAAVADPSAIDDRWGASTPVEALPWAAPAHEVRAGGFTIVNRRPDDSAAPEDPEGPDDPATLGAMTETAFAGSEAGRADVIDLIADRSFGSGSHATTRLCLDALRRALTRPTSRGTTPPPTVLDVGTGSGILAIAAGRIGARVIVCDTDPAARRAASANAERNGVTIEWVDGPSQSPKVDLVVANLLTADMAPLAEDIWSALVPGGSLIASGCLATESAQVVALFPEATLAGEEHSEGWAAVELRAPIAGPG